MAELVLLPRHHIARIVRRCDERRDALLNVLGIGYSDDHRDVRAGAAGNKCLLTRKDKIFSIPHSPSLNSRGFGAGMRLRQMNAAEPFAAG